MPPFFDIAVEPTRNLVKIKMGGFFAKRDIEAFRFALREKIRVLSCGANDHLTLCDITKMDIQSQDIVDMFSTVVGDPVFRSKCLAFLTASTLARSQAQRLTDRDGVAFFSNEAEAQAWLLSCF